MTKPATGTANKFASSDTAGKRWNTSTLGTATPSCAPSVTAIGSRSHRGPGNRSRNQGPSTHTPAVAPTDNQKPTDHTKSGSNITKAMIASASRRTGDACAPRTKAVAARIAITPARSTDGSKRVSAMNHATTATVAAHRHDGRNRRSNGKAAASTKATFCPDTAVRCERPDPRKASISSGRWRASSPMTSPVNSAASSLPIVASATRRSERRTRLLARSSTDPSCTSANTVGVKRPTTWRTAARRAPVVSALRLPCTHTNSPACRSASLRR